MTRSGGVGLGTFLLKARPIRTAGILVAITAMLLFASIMVQQALSITGPQAAEQALGNASGNMQQAGLARLGTPTTADDTFLRDAVRSAGGRAVGVYWNDYVRHPDGAANVTANLYENEWGSSPSSAAVELRSGRWTHSSSEAVVSPALAARWPLGSTLAFYSGHLRLKVVGVARERFQRDSSVVFLRPGTLTGVRMSDADARRAGVSLQRTIAWNGSPNTAAISAAVQKVIARTNQGENVYPYFSDRSTIELYTPSTRPQIVIASLIAPFLAALVGGIIALRFATRVRQTMWTVGVSWRRTRNATLTAVFGSTTIGAAIGIAAGIALGAVSRLVLAPFWIRELGDPTSLTGPIVGFLVLQAAGATAALIALRRGATKKVSRAHARITRLLPVAAAVCFAVAGTAMLSIGNNDVVLASTAAFCYGLVVLALTPAVFAALAHARPRSMPTLLAVRRILAERRSTSITLVAVTTLVLLGFCLATFVASLYAAGNAFEAKSSPVLPDQLQLTPQTGSQSADDRVRSDLQTAVGLSAPVRTRIITTPTSDNDQSIVAVKSTAAFEQLTRVKLGNTAARSLVSGGAVIVDGSRTSEITFEKHGSTPVRVIDAVPVAGVPNTWNRDTAFILDKTVTRLHLATDVTTYTYNHVTVAQRDSARAAALRLGFEPAWVTPYRDPPVAEQGIKTALAGSTLSVLAGLLMLLVAVFEGRSLRPSLAGLRAVGVGSPWIARAVAARSLLLATIALLLALIGAIGGVAAMLRVSGRDIVVAPPVTALAATTVALLLITALGSAFAARRLRVTERAL